MDALTGSEGVGQRFPTRPALALVPVGVASRHIVDGMPGWNGTGRGKPAYRLCDFSAPAWLPSHSSHLRALELCSLVPDRRPLVLDFAPKRCSQRLPMIDPRKGDESEISTLTITIGDGAGAVGVTSPPRPGSTTVTRSALRPGGPINRTLQSHPRCSAPAANEEARISSSHGTSRIRHEILVDGRKSKHLCSPLLNLSDQSSSGQSVQNLFEVI